MTIRTQEELSRSILRRLTLLERRVSRRSPRPTPTHGTAAERDAVWGTPTTDAERVALANARPVWFNTDKGWEESYYAPSGLAGLTAQGLVAGVPADWYPTGLGPYGCLRPSTGTSVSVGNYVTGWLGTFTRRGGAEWVTGTNNGLVLHKPGRWNFRAFTNQQSGSGVARYSLRLLSAGATTILAGRSHAANPLQPSPTLTPADYEFEFTTNQLTQALLYVDSGTLAVHQTAETNGVRGELLARYLGPALATD